MLEFLHSKKFFGLIILLTLLFVLILIVPPAIEKLTGKSIQTTAFTANTQLATFNQTPIYVSDLNALALEQYRINDAKSLNAAKLDNLLNTYIERKIFDKQKLGDVSAEIAKIQKTTGLTGNAAKYEALREKFITTAVKNWNAYTINFWLAPEDNLGQASAARQQLSADVNKALDFAKTEMQKGTSVYNVATQIIKNYPSLVKIIAVNISKFDSLANPSTWNTPATFYYDKANADDPFYKTLYAMTESSPVTKVLNNGNMGGSIIKIVKINNPNGILDSYQNWLKSQESSLVITNDAIQKIRNTK